jgi:hypothetical protein
MLRTRVCGEGGDSLDRWAHVFPLMMRRWLRCCLTHGASLLIQFSRRLDSVVVGVSAFGPVVPRLLRYIGQPGNGLHILQTEFYGHQETERRSMLHSEGLTAKMRGEQCLGMAGSRQVDRGVSPVDLRNTRAK